MQGTVSYNKRVEFVNKSNRKLLQCLKQGSNMIRFVLKKKISGCYVASRLENLLRDVGEPVRRHL